MRYLVEDIRAQQVISGLDKTGGHGFLTGTEGHTGIVVLLVGLVVTFGVSDLLLKVVMVLGFVLTDTVPESPLSISINVHLDDTGFDSVSDVFDRRTRTTVEDKVHGFGVVSAELFLDVLLGVVEDFGLQLNISRSINTVDVSERGGAGELSVGDLAEFLVGVPDFFGLSVKTRRVDVGVVNTIFLATGNTELELEEKINLRHAFHVLLADGNIFFEGFLGEIKHVRREKGFAVFLVVCLASFDEGVEPGQPSLLTMVGVKHNGDTVKGGNLANVLGCSDASSNGGRVVLVLERLSGNELSTSLGESHHNGASVLSGGFHTGVDGVATDDIDTGDGVTLFLSGSK
mmetsp:Transcript_13341/g.25325  ORF Transcript_13341/g.25325 Transcript_13341/m.25325 type:complete len:345 (+) Transcript_13341:101-1135(+)